MSKHKHINISLPFLLPTSLWLGRGTLALARTFHSASSSGHICLDVKTWYVLGSFWLSLMNLVWVLCVLCCSCICVTKLITNSRACAALSICCLSSPTLSFVEHLVGWATALASEHNCLYTSFDGNCKRCVEVLSQ